MLLTNSFDVAQPLDKVWAFFDDIPAVAACLPGGQVETLIGPYGHYVYLRYTVDQGR